jgi:hypothetical protein
MEIGNFGALVYSSFDSIASDKFCGLKSAGFFDKTADTVGIVLPSSSLPETLVTNQQLLRRIARIILEQEPDTPRRYVFIVHSVDGEDESKRCEELVTSSMRSLLEDTALALSPSSNDPTHVGPDSVQASLSRISVVSLPPVAQREAYAASKQALLGVLAVGDGGKNSLSLMERVRKFRQQWKDIPLQPEPALSSVRTRDLILCEHVL